MNARYHPVLLVEDDANDILLIERAFRKANLLNPLMVVRDGEEAISFLAGTVTAPPDQEKNPVPILILLDLKLPKKSGAEVLEWLRQQPGLRRIPAVVLTSSNQSADVNRVYELGANSYLVKPVAFDSLLELVKTLNLYWLILNEKPDVPLK